MIVALTGGASILCPRLGVVRHRTFRQHVGQELRGEVHGLDWSSGARAAIVAMPISGRAAKWLGRGKFPVAKYGIQSVGRLLKRL
jgi:hypothetical protein